MDKVVTKCSPNLFGEHTKQDRTGRLNQAEDSLQNCQEEQPGAPEGEHHLLHVCHLFKTKALVPQSCHCANEK